MESGQQAGNNLMAATWTGAAKVRRAFKAGPKRKTDVEYDTDTAIMQARILMLALRKAMLEAGIFTSSEDLRVALVQMSPEGAEIGVVSLLNVPREPNDLPRTYALASAFEQETKAVPMGVAVWLRDREAGSKSAVSVWVQPWLISPRARRAAMAAREAFMQSEGVETDSTF